MTSRRTASRSSSAIGIAAVTIVCGLATWTATRSDPPPTAATPPAATTSTREPTTASVDTTTNTPTPVAPASEPTPPDGPTPTPGPALAATPTPTAPAAVADDEFTAQQRRAALRASRETLAALEAVLPDGARPAIPHVDPTSWLATTPFHTPPPAGMQRSVTDITTRIATDDDRTLYVHATWRILDHAPDTEPTGRHVAGQPRDFILEVVHQDPGWLVTDLHPELPLGRGHEHTH